VFRFLFGLILGIAAGYALASVIAQQQDPATTPHS
jgi:hypothetical protein